MNTMGAMGAKGLGFKLSLFFCAFLTFSSTVLIFISYKTGRDLLNREATARYTSITKNLAFNGEYGVLTRNKDILDKVVGGVKEEDDVNHVLVTDRTGQILTEVGASRQPSRKIELPVKTQAASESEDASFLMGGEGPGPSTGSGARTEVIGNVSVEFDLAPIQKKFRRLAFIAVLATLVFIIIGAVMTIFIVQMMVAPLNRAVAALDEIASGGGNLNKKLEVSSEDEVGQLARNFNRFTDTLAGIVQAVRDTSTRIAVAAQQLTALSQTMSKIAGETSSQANAVSVSAAEVNASIQTVAQGTVEMGASIRDIGQNVSEASKVAMSAVRVGNETNVKVTELGTSGMEIGTIITAINFIAKQTNLLALNAAIEAAHAGAAGQGFAAVATEVRNLAEGTAKATADIKQKIETIQTNTSGTMSSIGQIADIIKEISGIQTAISVAIEEQTKTTQQISNSLAAAAQGSSEIATSITHVAREAKSASSGAADTQNAASELARMATELQELVRQFN